MSPSEAGRTLPPAVPGFQVRPDRLREHYGRLRLSPPRILPRTGWGNVLVRAPNWLGDAVMALPALSHLADLLPGARISVLAVARVAPLFWHRPEVAEVITYPPRPPSGPLGPWLQALARLRRRHFDLAVLFPNSFESAFTVWLLGVPQRLGYATDGRGLLLNPALWGWRHLDRLHQVYRHLGLLAAWGEPPTPRLPHIPLESGERDRAREMAAAGGWRPDRPLIGLSPGAAYGTAKQWPPERFAAVAEALRAETGAHIVLLGGGGDVTASRMVAGCMAAPPQDLTGRTDLRQALALSGCLDLLVTNDSGLMHAAAALGTPLVAVFGPTDPITTGPFTSQADLVSEPAACAPCLLRHCPTDHRCMLAVTPAAVLAAARRQLEGG